jgi:hypothetical protein
LNVRPGITALALLEHTIFGFHLDFCKNGNTFLDLLDEDDVFQSEGQRIKTPLHLNTAACGKKTTNLECPSA